MRTWVAFSTLGLTAGFLVGLALAVIAGGLGSPVGLILFLLGSGAVYSLITGRALSRITREAAAGAGA